jgi:hypothetical protein
MDVEMCGLGRWRCGGVKNKVFERKDAYWGTAGIRVGMIVKGFVLPSSLSSYSFGVGGFPNCEIWRLSKL